MDTMLASELMALLMFLTICGVLMFGYPVAPTLGGVALFFALLGYGLGLFDLSYLDAIPNRIYGLVDNTTLQAIPLFVFMGVMLERTRMAEDLLETMGVLFGSWRGGLGISVTLVGMLLAASTGIVGATVVTMGLISLPTMLRRGYDPALACGTICASGTLGQIIPPSIILVLLGDVLSSAYQQAQLKMGIFSPDTVSVGDLFVGAVLPGLLLVVLYLVYLILLALFKPSVMPAIPQAERDSYHLNFNIYVQIVKVLLPPLFLILAVLGSILGGLATTTEAAGLGALGSIVLALVNRQLTFARLLAVMQNTTKITCMVFLILIGAAIFSLVFRGFGGDDAVHQFLTTLPGGAFTAMVMVMLVMFFLGFIIDFIEIIYIVVPIVAPVLLAMGYDPIWLGVMIAVNLQTSFLTPPFGFSLFYLRGVAPASVATLDIYRGVLPFIGLQLLGLCILAAVPSLATWLPHLVYK